MKYFSKFALEQGNLLYQITKLSDEKKDSVNMLETIIL